jgi:hypothetical protein
MKKKKKKMEMKREKKKGETEWILACTITNANV